MQSQSLSDHDREVGTLLRPQSQRRAPDRPNGLIKDEPSRKRLAKRTVRAIVRFCIALLMGVGATLAWQSYGDEAKKTISIWVPALGRVLPAGGSAENTAVPQSAPLPQIPRAAATSSDIMRQLEPIARDLAGAQRSLEQLAARQEQIAQSTATLQAFEQDIINKLASSHQSPPVPLPRRKPSHPAAQPSALKPASVPPASPSPREPLSLH